MSIDRMGKVCGQVTLEKDLKSDDEWRWIPFLCDPAELTMDRDRKLFQQVKEGQAKPYLRFYRWQSPTLSYGRTQGIDHESKFQAAQKGWQVVERPTGGGKVFHQSDLCFTLAWRKDHRTLPWKVSDSYFVIHGWIQKSLKDLGIETEILERGTIANRGEGWCFQSAVCFDLLKCGRKIVGGAQWRERRAALHQGSIQLELTGETLTTLKRNFQLFFQASFED